MSGTKSGTKREGDSKAGSSPGATRPRRRQARGEARIAQLLDAAADVFSSTGYTAASTNAIAREAGVSPGTLYQFFPNKEAIAIELGDRLLNRWQETYGAAFVLSHIELPLDEMLDAILDPLITFNVENPAFSVLMHGSEIPGVITQEHDTVHATMLTRVESILAGYLTELPAGQVSRIANMAFVIFKTGLDLIMAHEGDERDAYVKELKTILFRYLEPLVGASALPDSACPKSCEA
ncbi:TetR family transcriptional regulator [Streptomyces finlayi]|uniref:TetR family transcriptional regulator n=1 Tax=Streptomyces finlayi TaxID=67296 RepID=A0A7G7BVN3_9ACTN|nr:TetR/AcrR family transcriptional regulator [Streptomyces finlayi]QNE79398.1 TetR family transcriptional regulator [Streptomyces finlayi]